MRLVSILSITLGLCSCRPAPQVIVRPAPAVSGSASKESYAGVISNVSPCVVSVFTRENISNKTYSQLTNEPGLRQFIESQSEKSPEGIPDQVEGIGSGVLISNDGYILTSSHVVQGADEITVTTSQEKEFKAHIVGLDPPTDVAVLKVDAKGLPSAQFADSSQLRVGDVVLAMGNPFGVGQTVTSGIISATERAGFGITEYEDFIQTDASINPGSSGGALVDTEGRVVGISTAILSRSGSSMGIGFAVPINLARGVMNQLIAHGRVDRGYLGVVLHSMTPEMANIFHLPEKKGALVIGVMPDSPASHAGLVPGDVIAELNHKPLTDAREFRMFLAQAPPGTRATVKVIRSEGEKVFPVTLSTTPKS